MKISKKQKIVSVFSILIILISLAVMLCDFLIPLNFWTFPLLNFLFCLFVGFGLLGLGLGFVNRSPWYFFISSTLLGLALFYAIIQYVIWWICIVIFFVLLAVVAIVSFMTAGNKTEDVALNKSPEYKNYEQRRAEKLEAEAKAEQEKEELPEIKSFKD